ncbi:hypothetical protein A3K55_02375 [Candidatus Shapirobacteria bacterium RBG_13_44_7]|uniref:Uncharacterized protein n=1 Tax=Candidatus Shapirobacteria bacterium RBG_13_44_7 TaxID=1802149 RepID=A0A1F7SEZ5_9BACT|nr:MAG: hypothetical protein A3K55_02375 [Candidatus Shapirobacteria bacterium RBG_13_44_7]
MTDTDRNSRTLILCFVVAIMVLIPLRFVEAGQSVGVGSTTQVLGEVEEVGNPELEAPYAEIESEGCWDQARADAEVGKITEGLVVEDLTREEVESISVEVAKIQARVCE